MPEKMMTNKNECIELIEAQVRIFYFSLFVMLMVPTLAWFFPWIPHGETPAEFFQRSGSALLAIGLLAELSAVRVYGILNPSGIVGNDYLEAREKYRNYPARMTYTVLVVIAVGTIISGYGDLLYIDNSQHLEAHHQLDEKARRVAGFWSCGEWYVWPDHEDDFEDLANQLCDINQELN